MSDKRTRSTFTSRGASIATLNLEEICFVVEKYSYTSNGFLWSSRPRWCLRFISEPWSTISKKLKSGGNWYFTLNSAYETGLVTGLVLDAVKELESLGDKIAGKSDDEVDNMLSKILLKLGLAGIDVKCMFTEVDSKLEEILEIPTGKVFYSRSDAVEMSSKKNTPKRGRASDGKRRKKSCTRREASC